MEHSEQAGEQSNKSESATPSDAISRSEQPPTYSVSTWDHEVQGWYPRTENTTKWRLRYWLRTLYNESWDRVSILIERN